MNNTKQSLTPSLSAGRFLAMSALSGTIATIVYFVITQYIMEASPNPIVQGAAGLNVVFAPLKLPIAILICAIALAIVHYAAKGRLQLKYSVVIATLVGAAVLVGYF